MPRDGSSIAAPPPLTAAVSGEPVSSVKFNSVISDIYSILNGIQSVSLGGTGATSYATFMTAASIYSKADVDYRVSQFMTINTHGAPAKPVLVDADEFAIADSAATFELKKPTWANIKSSFLAQNLTLKSLEDLALVAGDMLYATAADTVVRLAKGTDGQILKMGASAPSWVNDTALVEIESKAAIGASIAFINLADYAYVELVFDSVVFSDVNAPFIRLSTDNGASYASAAASYRGAVANDETGINSDTEINTNDDPTLGAVSGRLCLSYFNALEKTVVDGLLRVGTKIDKVVARRSVAEVNNAILFSTSVGTMTSGTVTAWGRKR